MMRKWLRGESRVSISNAFVRRVLGNFKGMQVFLKTERERERGRERGEGKGEKEGEGKKGAENGTRHEDEDVFAKADKLQTNYPADVGKRASLPSRVH
jgi:hypothetical protein